MEDGLVRGEWTGGKVCGHIKRQSDVSYALEFPASMPLPHYVTFNYRAYGGDAGETLRAVEAYRYARCAETGHIRNQWRHVSNPATGDAWIEVKLPRNEIMIADVEDLALVEARTLYTSSGYAVSGKRVDGKWTIIGFHRDLVPGAELVDHIDGDTLNNRRRNLRAGTPAMNARNRTLSSRNKTGITGIHAARGKYFASWHENGKQRKNHFRLKNTATRRPGRVR